MEDVGDRFLDLVHDLDEVMRTLSPEQAHDRFDETTLQVFWKRWPHVSAWAGALWRMLSEEMAGPSSPHLDPELDEIGESG
jgi:hypothetical protein